MDGKEFNRTKLLVIDALVANVNESTQELAIRAKRDEDRLVRLASALDNRIFDVFLFLFRYGPATWDQLISVFPRGTLSRALLRLESYGVIVKKNYRYRVL